MDRPLPPQTTIGVLSPHLDMHYYYVGILAGIQQVAEQHGVRVLGIRSQRPDQIRPPSLAWEQVAGWIAVMESDGLEAIARAAPLVTIGGAARPALECPAVMPDNVAGTAALVNHLIDHGHTAIAFVGYLENPDIRQRYDGYRAALAERGIRFDPRLVYPCSDGGYGERDGREAARHLIQSGLACTAIVGSTDLTAIGVLEELHAGGYRVPDDVAVAGFDDLYLAPFTAPALTTVRHPFEALGRTAAGLLLDTIAGLPVAPGITYVDTSLVVRRSCGCAAVAGVPLVRAAGRWQDTLASQLRQFVAQQLTGRDRAVAPPTWSGAQTVAAGLAAAMYGSEPPAPGAGERAWHEVVALGVDLGALQTIHARLERAARTHAPRARAAAGQVAAYLDHCYVEAMRAYRAQSIGHTRRIQDLIATNYRISTEISTWRDQGVARGQRLAWLRHTTVSRGCLCRWEDRDAGRDATITVTDVYGQDAQPQVGLEYAAASFPPTAMLAAARERGEMVAVVPFESAGGNWWLLVLSVALETRFLTDRENFGMWATLLGAALEREALLRSLIEQQAELHAANRALQAAKEVAEQADQLKTRLLANVSHELRTPLDSILGYSRAAGERLDDKAPETPQTLRHDLGRIVQNAEHLMHVLDDLLDLSRAEVQALSLAPELIAPRSFLGDVFAAVAGQQRAGEVEWALELPEHLPWIEADPVRLRQIVLNLLSNARKFTAAGRVVLGAEVAPPHLHLWVADSGAGIPADQQEHIFEPFVSQQPSGMRQAGVGLGLSIARHLVALHDGLLTLESAPGSGSTFHVYLPLPSLERPASAAHVDSGGPPALLWIAASRRLPDAIVELAARRGLALRQVAPGDDLEAVLAAFSPTLLAWDASAAEAGAVVEQLRRRPQLCRLPVLLYGEQSAERGAQLTGVLLKPVSSVVLGEALSGLGVQRTAGSILIVDDDADARRLYRNVVSTALPSFAVEAVDGGAAALALLAEVTPDLVILDLTMPEVDGFAVLDALRRNRRTRQVPVVILSGRMLTAQDMQRLDHAQVVFHTKDTLSPAETAQQLDRALSPAEHLAAPTSLLVKRTLAFFHQHYARQVTRQEVADAVGVTSHYLSRIFRQELGIGPWDYLNRLRVRQAKELLVPGANITGVAAEVGFPDVGYFGRIFRRYAGCSPRDYRDQPR